MSPSDPSSNVGDMLRQTADRLFGRHTQAGADSLWAEITAA